MVPPFEATLSAHLVHTDRRGGLNPPECIKKSFSGRFNLPLQWMKTLLKMLTRCTERVAQEGMEYISMMLFYIKS